MYYCEYAGLCDRVMIDVLFWETQSNPVRNDQFFSSLKTSRLLNVKACYFFLINFYGEIYFTERKITEYFYINVRKQRTWLPSRSQCFSYII